MSSPPNGDHIPSPSSPVPISPARRRSASPSEISDLTSRPRHSPTVTRAFDPNDPQVRERQLTMDVDMARHLSRARRETLSISPGTNHEHPQASPEHMFSSIPDLSHHEQHEISMARGDAQPGGHEYAEEEPIMSSDPHRTPDSSLLATLVDNPPLHSTHPAHRPPSIFGGLPTYQANVSPSEFDFRLLEEFAVGEKAALGIPTAANTRFSLSALQSRPTTSTAVDSTIEQQPLSEEGPSDPNNNEATSTPRSVRHRKLSQSNPYPRVHRKGIGGKMALFERTLGDSPPALPAHLGIPPLGGPSLATGPSYEQSGIPGGILNTGHDRPYRFSFYSNALSATIHARSLSELPAEGQTFEDLFTGIPPPPAGQARDDSRDRPSSSGFSASTTPKVDVFGNGNGNGFSNGNANGSRRPPFQGGLKHGPPIGNGDSEPNTWWLDVQSPTDDEMKMLSKVR